MVNAGSVLHLCLVWSSVKHCLLVTCVQSANKGEVALGVVIVLSVVVETFVAAYCVVSCTLRLVGEPDCECTTSLLKTLDVSTSRSSSRYLH